MTNRAIPQVILAFVSGAACAPVNTVPGPVSPTAAGQYYDLEIPPDLDIRAVDFSASTFSAVSGAGGSTPSQMGGRAFVEVYAVGRTTAQQLLLLPLLGSAALPTRALSGQITYLAVASGNAGHMLRAAYRNGRLVSVEVSASVLGRGVMLEGVSMRGQPVRVRVDSINADYEP